MTECACPTRFSRPTATTLGRLSLILESSLDGSRAPVELDYALEGQPDLPCLVVLGGISASRQLGQWWPDQTGPGRPLDPQQFLLLGIDYLAALPCGFSGLTPTDQASALAALLDHLGIPRVAAIVGASYGGAVALAFAERYPDRLDAALVISMAARPSPMASALRSVQRELLRLGREHGFDAVALARALALTTYRSEAEFARRFDGAPQLQDGRWRLPVEDYLEAQGRRFATRFCSERYRLLSESLDLHRVDPARIGTPLHLLAVAQDRLVPAQDIADLAGATGAQLTTLSSEFGHDAFLTEAAAVSEWLLHSLGSLGRMWRQAA